MLDVLRVEIPWVALDDDRDPTWRESFCLYSYLHPERDWLLYIGKADYQSVRQRLHGDHKADLFDFFARRYGIDQVRVLQGDLVLEEGRRRSSDLLGLIESLLIRSEEHTSELQSRLHLVCRLLLEKKKNDQ